MELADRLNASADAKEPIEIARGSIAWLIEKYRAGDDYKARWLG